MKIIVLNGSPRPAGNTKAMISAFTEGAESAGHEVTVFDINASGGWFAILYGGEEQSATYRQMIIAHLDEEDSRLIQTLPKEVEFRLSLEEPYREQ